MLHGLVIFAVYFAVDNPRSRRSPDLPIEISFQDATPVMSQNQDRKTPGSRGSQRTSVQSSVETSAGSTGRLQTLSDQATATDQAAPGTGHGWSDAVQFGNSMDLQQTFASLPFFIALHSKVDSSLVYPDDFSRQRLTGKVRIEAELSPDGRIIRFVGTVAQDRVLQTYCLAFLTQALKQPLPQRVWADRPQVVAFEFDFHTHIPGEPQRTFPPLVQKNRLAFGRDNQIEPLVNERLNELFTHYIPPIIPLPGGVYIDFVLAYQYIENLIEGAPTERDLRQGRIESLHLHLKEMLRHPTSPTPQPSGNISPES